MDAEIGFKYGWPKNAWDCRYEISKTAFLDITIFFYVTHNNAILYAVEIFNIKIGINSVVFSPLANYTDRAIAAGQRS
jgi:hypothetical protein